MIESIDVLHLGASHSEVLDFTCVVVDNPIEVNQYVRWISNEYDQKIAARDGCLSQMSQGLLSFFIRLVLPSVVQDGKQARFRERAFRTTSSTRAY